LHYQQAAKTMEPSAFKRYECNQVGPLSQITMVRLAPVMALQLSHYATAKNCTQSVVIRCAIHDLLLNEGIDAYSPLDQQQPQSV
jgi:hypothetical protein